MELMGCLRVKRAPKVRTDPCIITLGKRRLASGVGAYELNDQKEVIEHGSDDLFR
jgi:hypothetical protein